MTTTTFTCIGGYDGEPGRCEHCNKHLKHGVRTSTHGVIGADCFVKLIAVDRNRFNGNGKPSPSMVRDYAKMVEFWSAERRSRMGYHSESFVFGLAA
jgi:hypothetical protein